MAKRKPTKVKDVPVQIARWMDQARHDLESARKNFRLRVYDVAIVMSEQSLAKALYFEIDCRRIADDSNGV